MSEEMNIPFKGVALLMRSLDFARDDKRGGEAFSPLKNNCSAIGLESDFCFAGLIALEGSLLGLGFFVVDEEL